jgi:hypothetical protein
VCLPASFIVKSHSTYKHEFVPGRRFSYKQLCIDKNDKNTAIIKMSELEVDSDQKNKESKAPVSLVALVFVCLQAVKQGIIWSAYIGVIFNNLTVISEFCIQPR